MSIKSETTALRYGIKSRYVRAVHFFFFFLHIRWCRIVFTRKKSEVIVGGGGRITIENYSAEGQKRLNTINMNKGTTIKRKQRLP